jgi:hypothetical protein
MKQWLYMLEHELGRLLVCGDTKDLGPGLWRYLPADLTKWAREYWMDQFCGIEHGQDGNDTVGLETDLITFAAC